MTSEAIQARLTDMADQLKACVTVNDPAGATQE